MRGLYFDGKNATYREDLPIPQPGEGESLIHVSLAAVCSTDREVLKGYKPDFSGVMGHEFVGVVEQSSDPAMVGKRVVGELNEGCLDCLYCRSGREKHCLSRRVLGLDHKDGCFAEYMIEATRLLHLVPDNLPDEQAVFTEPLAAALEIPTRLHIAPTEEVCVIGDGRMGLMIAQVLALGGADVTVLGRHEEKLKLFEPFAHTATHLDRTFEIVVDAAGSAAGLELATRLVRNQGTIVLKSTYAGDAQVNMSYFVVNEITIRGSRCGPFEPALRYLSRGLVKLPAIELHDLADWQAAFTSHAFKAAFDFRGKSSAK